MQFKFDANQPYQLDAIAAVVDLFAGQPYVGMTLTGLDGNQVFPNRLNLEEEELLTNLQAVQQRGGLAVDACLQTLPLSLPVENGDVENAAFPEVFYRTSPFAFPNFTVEMETGTGKTYVYLRTALELYRTYGLRKFIIVVPSVAIREGVLKTLQITEAHFKGLYQNVTYRYYPYDSGNLNRVPQFAQSATLELMVMTLAAFNKDANVVYQSTDRLQGRVPMDLLQASRPVLILDEPQNMEGPASRRALAALSPLFALRYSATHRTPYNVIYRLTPYEAYRQGLVKRIEVAGVEEVDSANRPYIRVEEIKSHKQTVTARLAIQQLFKDGTVKEAVVTVRPGDNLEALANRSDYAPYTVEEINLAYNSVLFSDGLELARGEACGADKEAVWEAQIAYTLEEHFRKQRRLLDQGIKVLSLFFIDRVDNYAYPDSPLRVLFDRTFDAVCRKYPDVCQALWGSATPEAEAVQAAYFANRRTREGKLIYEDSKSGESQKDKEVYDLIMKDKELLLSFGEPVGFIFSHSALREGWDNPNVFQICTLNQTASEIKKRQEIGRGVRLAVTQEGDRVHEERVNVLTVIANESYERYVTTLQTEYAEDYGTENTPPPPVNARQKQLVHLRKQYLLSEEFQALWDKIKYRTRYRVRIDSERLIGEVVTELEYAEIRPPRVAVSKAQVRVDAADVLQAVTISENRELLTLAGHAPLPNLVTLMEELLQRTTPPLCLSRRTLLEVYKRTSRQQAAIDNPFEFATVVVGILKRRLMDQLVDGIQYEKIDSFYEMSQFDLEVEALQAHLVPAERALYDQISVDSEEEAAFVHALERNDAVKLYVKLPGWFTVDTPLGSYNPDWAIVFEERDAYGEPQQTLYLVREQKPTTDLGKLRPDEARKIRCGKRHFCDALGVDFDVVTQDSVLP